MLYVRMRNVGGCCACEQSSVGYGNVHYKLRASCEDSHSSVDIRSHHRVTDALSQMICIIPYSLCDLVERRQSR